MIRYTQWKTKEGKIRYIRLYQAWHNMQGRVRGTKYDGAKIRRWKGLEIGFKNFKEFREWSLKNDYRKGMSLDRIDPNKGYIQDNCQWISVSENSKRAMMSKWK